MKVRLTIRYERLSVSLPNIIRMMKSRRMRRAGYVARMGEKRNANRILVGKSEGKRPLKITNFLIHLVGTKVIKVALLKRPKP
jgi:hypothetical protein